MRSYQSSRTFYNLLKPSRESVQQYKCNHHHSHAARMESITCSVALRTHARISIASIASSTCMACMACMTYMTCAKTLHAFVRPMLSSPLLSTNFPLKACGLPSSPKGVRGISVHALLALNIMTTVLVLELCQLPRDENDLNAAFIPTNT